MSVELIGVVVTAFAVLVTLGSGMFAGFAWVVRRIDGVDGKLSARIDGVEGRLTARIDGVEGRLSARIDGVEERLSARIDGVEGSLSARIDGLQAELTEVKIGIARLEGPRPHLIVGR
ncbi:hypothetical protein SAMN04488591_2394 [Microbacterium azadirachtae]|uniref:Uncharacterized protein n=2 Tax=Microbacterium azadirachtae TaxID=582680 RepID=A0A1I6I3I6_9MICO|nr:hypothetical protein [Microbacterium azadirachtae]SFR61295.1 hypothetical protein SAMN04488591_2394 [Microbacterium azadirachtae]